MSGNILNANQNSLSSLAVDYLAYFYHVFPLHLNTFNRLFGVVINPKLLKLKSSVSGFTDLNSDISEFIDSLKGISNYLDKYNPSELLIKLVETFDGNTYLIPVKSDINKLIGEIDVKTKYDQIIGHLHSVSSSYNRSLQTSFVSFKTKIEGHKKSFEESINQYIKKINTSLNNHSSCVQKLIKLICDIESQITKFTENYSKIGRISGYYSVKSIIQTGKPFTAPEINQIFLTLVNYRNDLREFNKHKSRLSHIVKQLKFYSELVTKIENNNSEKLSDYISNAHTISGTLDNLKIYLGEFDEYMKKAKLKEIGEHISTMKSLLSKVNDQVKPEAKSYIEGLSNININYSEVESNIKTIRSMNNLVIGKLQIARHTIDFFNILQEEIKKLDGIYFYYHNDIDYLKLELSTVQYKLTSFETNINGAINKIKGDIEKIKVENHTFVVQGNTYDESFYKKLMSQVETFIDNSLNVINVITYLLPRLESNKNDSPKISDIKCKVSEITKLNDAPSKLTQIKQQLEKFVKLQESTKFLIDTFSTHHWKFTSLSKFSTTLDQIINDSNSLIRYINYSSDYLRTIGYVHNLVTWINSCYSSRFREIKEIIKKFNPNVKKIITRLETINKNLCLIKTLCPKKVENNLDRLKDYMMNLKVYVTHIRNNFNVITGVNDKIKKDISKIDSYKSELESLEKYIECYIKWIKKCKKITFIEKYLEGIKDRLNEILVLLKHIIDFHGNPKCIKKIQSKLKDVESSVSELECAIEGVARNFIQCSTKSLSTHLINWNSMDHNGIVKDNIKII